MVVYVKLRVKSRTNVTKDLVALVGGGAHSPRPVLVVDEDVGKELGYTKGEVWEAAIADTRREVYLIEEAVVLELLGEEGEVLDSVTADLVIHPRLEEPLITDATIDALGIKVESFYRGLWRHASDPITRVRRSARLAASA